MSEMPKVITKNQSISYGIVAFNNFLHSGNTSDFNVSTIEIFIKGAMETHNKKDIVEIANNIIQKEKENRFKCQKL